MDVQLSKDDSLKYIDKILKYVDTVKLGKPIFSVSIVNNIDNFPQDPDDIDWRKANNSIIVHVLFREDSLKRGKNIIKAVELKY